MVSSTTPLQQRKLRNELFLNLKSLNPHIFGPLFWPSRYNKFWINKLQCDYPCVDRKASLSSFINFLLEALENFSYIIWDIVFSFIRIILEQVYQNILSQLITILHEQCMMLGCNFASNFLWTCDIEYSACKLDEQICYHARAYNWKQNNQGS